MSRMLQVKIGKMKKQRHSEISSFVGDIVKAGIPAAFARCFGSSLSIFYTTFLLSCSG